MKTLIICTRINAGKIQFIITQSSVDMISRQAPSPAIADENLSALPRMKPQLPVC